MWRLRWHGLTSRDVSVAASTTFPKVPSSCWRSGWTIRWKKSFLGRRNASPQRSRRQHIDLYSGTVQSNYLTNRVTTLRFTTLVGESSLVDTNLLRDRYLLWNLCPRVNVALWKTNGELQVC